MKDRKILITGATRGIGKATAIHFAKKGANLILTSRTENDLKNVSDECKKLGVQVDYILSDLSSIQNGIEFSKLVLSKQTDITDIVLNAGISTSKRFENNSIEDIEYEMNVNYLCPISIIKEFIPYFKEKKSGSIVCISSFSALTPFPSNSSYAATKSALFSLCNSLKIELAEYNIHVASILPGGTKTDMTKEFSSIPFIIDEPELIARAVEDAIIKKESVIIPGFVYSSLAQIYKIFPSPINSFLEFTVKNIFPKFGK
jgi:short-subunit dehydrogenase